MLYIFKNKIMFSILIGFLVVVGFGCKGVSQEEAVGIRPVTLNYWTVYDDTKALRSLASDFSALYPHISVNIKQVRDEEFENLFVNALADDVSPDMISIHVRDLAKYKERLGTAPASVKLSRLQTQGQYFKENILTTQELVLPSALTLKANFVGTIYDDVVDNNKIYGFPLAVDTIALYYNKDLLDKAGIPQAPETWEEFMEAIKATSKFRSDGSILQSGVAMGTADNIDNSFDLVSLLMLQSGTQMAQGNSVVFANSLNSKTENHPALSALRFYTDFAQPTKEVYTWGDDRGNALQEFARGTTAFYLGFAYDRTRIRVLAPQMNLEVVKVPQLSPEEPVNVANYWVEAVVKKAKYPNEAWGFMQFLTLPENIKKYSASTGQPSPVRAHIVEQKLDTNLAPFAELVLQSENWYRGRNFSQTKEAFTSMINGFLEPLEEGENKQARDANLIIQAARLVQQSM